MPVTELFAQRATLSRSVRLLGEFRYEQRDPARFYGALAADTAGMVSALWSGARPAGPPQGIVLDVGGGPGYFATAFTGSGWRYIGVEPDPREMHAADETRRGGPGTFVRASGMALPFADDSVDVCLSSNVAEHVAHPWRLGDEMLRVTRPGGLVGLIGGAGQEYLWDARAARAAAGRLAALAPTLPPLRSMSQRRGGVSCSSAALVNAQPAVQKGPRRQPSDEAALYVRMPSSLDCGKRNPANA